MSPLSHPDPCPILIEKNGFYFCGDYEHRPEQCKNHKHPFRHCPIGIEKLGLRDTTGIARRIDDGWEISKIL